MSETKIAEDEVLEAMRDVVDPELGINVVDLGLVYGVNIGDDHIITLERSTYVFGAGPAIKPTVVLSGIFP